MSNGVKCKNELRGVYIAITCNSILIPTAPRRYLFGLRFRILWVSLLAAKAIHNSNSIEVVINIVLALSIPKTSNCLRKRINVDVAPMSVVIIINFQDQLKICSVLDLGAFCILSDSAGSFPNANVGKLSVTKFIRNICIGSMAIGMPAIMLTTTTKISSKFTASINLTHFLILVYMVLQNPMADTIDAKLSSTKIISAASLATSVHFIDIATPTSAFLSAGASFTPSPVIATMCP